MRLIFGALLLVLLLASLDQTIVSTALPTIVFRELLDGWRPDEEPELQRLVDRLGRDLVSEIPAPPAVRVTHSDS